ncbi:glycoside hydrolase family 3 N-terminal domain-containing protein [Sphingomonas sp. MMS24-JH45]
MTITRRAALLGAGAAAAWASSPARALMDAAERRGLPASVEALIGRMTLEEAGEPDGRRLVGRGRGLAESAGNAANFDTQLADAVAGRITGVFNGNGAAMARQMQRAVMKQSRLKVPLIFAADVIHGHRTVFPVPVGEAASFEPDLARRTARVAASEAAGAGIDWTFFPMVDIARATSAWAARWRARARTGGWANSSPSRGSRASRATTSPPTTR